MKKFWLIPVVALTFSPFRSAADITQQPTCAPVYETCSYNSGCLSCHASAYITYQCQDGSRYTVAGGCCYCT
jgi:hypothetical protein